MERAKGDGGISCPELGKREQEPVEKVHKGSREEVGTVNLVVLVHRALLVIACLEPLRIDWKLPTKPSLVPCRELTGAGITL